MALKLRTKVNFPATVTGTGGFKVVKSNGVWTVSPDFSALAAIAGSSVTDPSLKQVWLYDPNLNQYNRLTLAGLGDALYLLSSTTSLAIATGSKTFSTQANKDIGVGSFVLAYSAADPANYMFGQVTAYSGTTLTVLVSLIGGSGTKTDWIIRASGAPGSIGPGYAATSVTSALIGNSGSKTLAIGLNYAYAVGSRVRATESAGSTAWMEGIVTAYSAGNLTFTADKKSGSGTFAAWNVSIAGEPGAGDLLSTNNLSDVANVATARANLGVSAQIAPLQHATLGGL